MVLRAEALQQQWHSASAKKKQARWLRSRGAADRLAVHGDSVDCQARVKNFVVPVGDAEQQEVAAGGSNREAGTRPASGAAP
jgi:hypothetical protein